MQFHEVRFPATLSFGSVGGPERRTDVVTISNGYEERNSPWAHSRRRYDAGMGMRSLDDIETLISFFEARFGQLFAFRWKDWSDYRSAKPSQDVSAFDQALGTGDGVRLEFPLIKTYQSGAYDYSRPIGKPVEGSVRVGVAGSELTVGTDYSVDASSGLVTLQQAPPTGAEVTAGFEFDVPVRFDTDRIQTSIASFKAGEVPNVPIVEVRI
ncbi:MAG: DUF2460 domain-containing protein [Paracoccaceae bacterium]|nr:DUF2460 domain-containing protein [Paracoccaceae bacterium]